MIQSKEVTAYRIEPLVKVIEAVVTNNLGYDSVRPKEEVFLRNYTLKAHLGRLESAYVFPDWYLEGKRRLPLISKMVFEIIDLPQQPFFQHPKVIPSQQSSD